MKKFFRKSCATRYGLKRIKIRFEFGVRKPKKIFLRLIGNN